MTPAPGRDPERDTIAGEMLERLVVDPDLHANERHLAHYRVQVDHLRRPGDALIAHGEPGEVLVATTLRKHEVVELLRTVADELESPSEELTTPRLRRG